MVRMLIRVALTIAGNAVGLLVANWILSDMSLDASAFIIAVLIFTGVEILVQPLLRQVAFKNQASAIQGSTALITTFVALLVTSFVSDGLSISGATTWVLATIIVWLVTMLAGVILPMIFLKNAVEQRRN